jgi:hypothetical protein
MLDNNKNNDVDPVTLVKKGSNKRLQLETKAKKGQNMSTNAGAIMKLYRRNLHLRGLGQQKVVQNVVPKVVGNEDIRAAPSTI